MDLRSLTPLLIGALIVWAVIRRIRRTIGRQPVHTKRLYVRIAVLSVIGVALLIASLHDLNVAGALVLGMGGGAALGWLGLRHTIFEQTTEGRFYTPHTYIGVLVTLLFVGRLVYRFAILNVGAGTPAPAVPDSFAFYQRSPLTLGLFGLLVGYYVVFNTGVLREARYPPVLPADSSRAPP